MQTQAVATPDITTDILRTIFSTNHKLDASLTLLRHLDHMLRLGNAMYIPIAARLAGTLDPMSHLVHDRESFSTSTSRQEFTGQRGTNDNATAARASFAAVSLLCMLLIAASLGNRFQSFWDRKYWGSMTVIQTLPYLLYFFGIGFVLASGVTVANLGLHQTTDRACKGAMYVCLVFYCAAKIIVQAFLIERAHAVRHKLKKRLADWVWTLFVVISVLGFGVIVILAFRDPDGKVDPNDHQCRIGLPRVALMVLMSWDIVINTTLTCTFIVLLLPLLVRSKAKKTGHVFGAKNSQTALQMEPCKQDPSPKLPSLVTARARESNAGSITPQRPLPRLPLVVDRGTDHLKGLVYKTIFGTMVMMTATIVNIVVLYRYHGFEHGWMCFACCMLDVTWTILILHFLTETKKEAVGPMLARQAYSSERLLAATNERLQTALYRPGLTRNVISEGGESLMTISSF